ncbi:MAG: divergent PAP2 family protein [bacterium]|nr:divergent PAP2 family protein [bacterium]
MKLLIYIIKNKKIDFRILVGTGGMPSSHSATVVALATAVGRIEGFRSSIFIVTSIVAIIIMTDAIGVRRAAGEQAKILNRMVDDLYREGKIKETRLKELLGHTPIEVIIGALFGIIVAVLCT